MDGSQGEQKQMSHKIDMEPDKALALVKLGASLLLLNVPPSTSYGMHTQVRLCSIAVFVMGSITCISLFKVALHLYQTKLIPEGL